MFPNRVEDIIPTQAGFRCSMENSIIGAQEKMSGHTQKEPRIPGYGWDGREGHGLQRAAR